MSTNVGIGYPQHDGLRSWPEAEIIGEPVKVKDLTEPRVLVQRRQPLILGSREEELVYFEGYPTISLFTGAGGFDIGLEQAGFVSVVQHEWTRGCCQTLIANRPNFFRHSALIQGDIRNTPTSMILREARLRVGEAYLLVGGPPCQGFSTCSKHAIKGKYDERNDLVFQFLRVVREAQPKFFIFENVPGFQSFNKGEYMKAFLEAAYDCYYELVYGLVDAVEYQVPQFRCRFICAGTRRDLADIDGNLAGLPKPICYADQDREKIKWYEGAPLFHTQDLELLMHAPGIRYFPDRPVLKVPMPVKHDSGKFKGRTKTFIDFYRKLRNEEPDRIVERPRG